MQDERIQDVRGEEARWDHVILELLIGTDRPWAVDEIKREVGDSQTAEDAIARLYGAGLVHRLESFVFATWAAVSASRLA